MSNHHRSTGRFTPPAKGRTSALPGVRLASPSTPGFLARGAFTMLFACSPELSTCAPGSHTGAESGATLADGLGFDVAVNHTAASQLAGGVQPYLDMSTGEVSLVLGRDVASGVVVAWESAIVPAVLAEVMATPAQGCVLAVGRPGTDQFVVLTHEAMRAFAWTLDTHAAFQPLMSHALTLLREAVVVDADGRPHLR